MTEDEFRAELKRLGINEVDFKIEMELVRREHQRSIFCTVPRGDKALMLDALLNIIERRRKDKQE